MSAEAFTQPVSETQGGVPAFGVYRLLTDECQRALHDVIDPLVEELNAGLHAGDLILPKANLVVDTTFAVTLAQKKNTIANYIDQGNVITKQDVFGLIDSLGDYGDLDIPIDNKELPWLGSKSYGKKHSKLVTMLRPPVGGKIYDQASAMRRWGAAIGGRLITTNLITPDHLTLVKATRDGSHERNYHPAVRDLVAEVTSERLQRANFTHITLGKLVIGSGYNLPLDLDSL